MKRYTKEEKRAILQVVDACVVFTEDRDGFASYPWIRSVLRMVTGRDLLWTSWVRHIRKWRNELMVDADMEDGTGPKWEEVR
jgi:hypothetical protein